jgi:hypothetical protein
VDLAPEFPVLDGDSGKPAGVAVHFLSLRSKPLMRIANLRFVGARSGGLAAQAGLVLSLCCYAPHSLTAIFEAALFSAPEASSSPRNYFAASLQAA